jgi:DNA-binding FadR family transcriptional regulator
MAGRVEKVAYSVAREIVAHVVEDQLAPGAVLESETDMMQRYEVSRGSLREALRILETLGFLQLKPGPRGGPVVLNPDARQFSKIATLYYQRIDATYRELLEVRQTLEAASAAMAAARRTPEDAEKLRALFKASRDADLADDRAFQTVGQGFHVMVAQMAGNRVLNFMLKSCTDVVASRTGHYLYPLGSRQAVADAHEKIGQAIIRGDVKAAEALMREHMEDYSSEAMAQYGGAMAEIVRW